MVVASEEEFPPLAGAKAGTASDPSSTVAYGDQGAALTDGSSKPKQITRTTIPVYSTINGAHVQMKLWYMVTFLQESWFTAGFHMFICCMLSLLDYFSDLFTNINCVAAMVSNLN